MILSEKQYNEIAAHCQACIDTGKDCEPVDCLCFSPEDVIDPDALVSIFGQVYTAHMKRLSPVIEQQVETIGRRYVYRRHSNWQVHLISYSLLFRSERTGETLLQIAREKRFAPYKLAKEYCKRFVSKDFKLARLLSDPHAEDVVATIPSAALREDLRQCCLQDRHYSQAADLLRQSAGREFEQLLYELMMARNLCFDTEAELRLQARRVCAALCLY